METNSKKIDLLKVAELDLRIWRAYHSNNFFILFLLSLKFMREYFCLNYIDALRAAYYSSFAAVDFRLHDGKENAKRVIHKLTKFYKIIEKNSFENFDCQKVAELEFNWWIIDRYPNQFKVSKEEALIATIAAIYSIDSSNLSEYTTHRAKLAVSSGNTKDFEINVNWDKIGLLLNHSFDSLYKNAQ